jgi:hypothetical protein
VPEEIAEPELGIRLVGDERAVERGEGEARELVGILAATSCARTATRAR